MSSKEESDEEELALDWLWTSSLEDNQETRLPLPKVEVLDSHPLRGNEEAKLEPNKVTNVPETPSSPI